MINDECRKKVLEKSLQKWKLRVDLRGCEKSQGIIQEILYLCWLDISGSRKGMEPDWEDAESGERINASCNGRKYCNKYQINTSKMHQLKIWHRILIWVAKKIEKLVPEQWWSMWSLNLWLDGWCQKWENMLKDGLYSEFRKLYQKSKNILEMLRWALEWTWEQVWYGLPVQR